MRAVGGLSPVYRLASDYVDRVCALNPIAATAIGVAGFEHDLTDYSPDGFAAMEALRAETLAALAATPVLDERDRICRDVMVDLLELQRERHAAGDHARDLSIIGSPAMQIRRTFDLMPREGEAAWESIADRMEKVPLALASFQRTLEDGVRRGTVAARRQALANSAQAAGWAGEGDAGAAFFAGLAAEARTLAPVASLTARIEAAAPLASAAYAEFGRYLREQYADAAAEADGVGRQRYQLASRAMNGIALDLDQTYEWGWEELFRVEREMRETCAKILPGAGIAETIDFLEADPGRSIEGEEPFRAWMQEIQDRTIAEMDGRHFDIPGPLKRIEALIAPPGGALAMYYTGPSEDFSRPGRTWYPTGGKTRFALWGEVSIAYHEGVPGHHLQIATTKYLKDELSRFQQLMAGTSGYVEGWALYAERLMGELGYLENPDYYLGMLRAQALRSVRIILDVGLHLGLAIPAASDFHPGETWTAALADEFARERSRFPANFMVSEVVRYLGTPGQAISYKVGERSWLAARESARRREGDAFDLKAWHRRALEMGPMGLGQLEREFAGL